MHYMLPSVFASVYTSCICWELHNALYLNLSFCFCIHLTYMFRTTQCNICYSCSCFCIHLMYMLRTTQCTIRYLQFLLLYTPHVYVENYTMHYMLPPVSASVYTSCICWELHNALYLNLSFCFCIHLMYMFRTTQCTICYSGFCFCIHLMYRLRTTQCTICYIQFLLLYTPHCKGYKDINFIICYLHGLQTFKINPLETADLKRDKPSSLHLCQANIQPLENLA